MHPPSLLRRRPSAPMIISLAALFLSLGGVGYAAVSLPANSVGSDQIRDNAVTFKKINPNSVGAVRLANSGVVNSKLANNSVSFKKIQAGAVGRVRANLNQLQARIADKCATGTAISSVDSTGKPTCSPTAPAQFGATSTGQVTVNAGDTNTTIASETLPAHASYLLFGTVNALVTKSTTGSPPADQWVQVSCTVNPGGTSASRTALAGVHLTDDNPVAVNIPIVLPATAGATANSANVTCTFANSGSPAPTVRATGSLNAITTASNS
jgi:hypothetical protein